MLRLLGGLIVYVSTLYCGPAARTGKGRGKEGGGLYPELAALGFREGSSSALISLVGRQCALLPSYEVARQELADRGTSLDIKVVHGTAKRLGAEALTARTRDLLRWRAGQLPAGRELAGKRVVAQMDGGRVRQRRVTRRQKGRGKNKRQRRRWKAEWREPKVLIIYEADEQGRMKPGTRPWIDGTFGGPDEVLELLAYHLHRLGASSASSVTFVADGAPWIWERLDWVVGRVGVSPEKVRRVLDWCHAVHNMGLALTALGLDKEERVELSRKLRRWLRRGCPGLVVEELERQGEARGDPEGLAQPLGYLRKHMEAGHLAYGRFRREGVPLGSGAVESAIRRVVNLRLKGPGLQWLGENAEGALVLRAAALSGRWEETMAWVGEAMSQNRQLGWEWRSPDMAAELKSGVPIKPPEAQKASGQGDGDKAA
jgi:hypothetical protein